MFFSTKTYGHDIGLSACFRQWRADSHCSMLHGYSLAISLKFAATELDNRNWVTDFGACKPIKEFLVGHFDHRTLVAVDDPNLKLFERMHDQKLINLNVVPNVGCEAFATQVWHFVSDWLHQYNLNQHTDVKLVEVEVREHGSNSAGVFRPHTTF